MSGISATFFNYGKPDLRLKVLPVTFHIPLANMQEAVEFFGNPENAAEWFDITRHGLIEEIASKLVKQPTADELLAALEAKNA